MHTRAMSTAPTPVDGIEARTVTGGGGSDVRVDETCPADGQPILFVHGFSASRLVWHEQITSDLADEFRLVATDTLANIIPNARMSFYAAVGHMPYLEDTDRFNRELREFVRKVVR